MLHETLEDVVQSADDPVTMLRNSPVGSFTFPVVEEEYTNWIEEQRAWRESVALADQSYHMTGLTVRGPDALGLFADLGISDYSDFQPGMAKQFLPCNPDGYTIGDGILFYFDDEELYVIGAPMAPNWVQFHAETGDYDVEVERHGSALELGEGESPTYFRYEVQGPNALAVIDVASDGAVPDTPFFHFGELRIAGHDVRGLRHSMSGEAGLEIWGPFEHGEDVKGAIMDAGEEYGIRHLGTKAYRSSGPMSGWVEFQLPAIYESEAMRPYREWLSAESPEANTSLGGSYYADDVTDYYLSPVDIGHGNRIDFDHDFVGKEALREMVDGQERTKVSLFWNRSDVREVQGSLHREGDTYKFMDMPYPGWAIAHYDEITTDGERVGVSKWPAYNYNERSVVSIASVDLEYSDPGTDLSVTWGDPESTKPQVERHVETDVRVTVGPVPPTGDRRR